MMDKSRLKSLLIKAISNKFIISFLIFFFWVFFFDQHSIWERKEYKSRIEALTKEKEYFLNKIKKDKNRIHELKTNRENLEKFAREQYLMKKKDEDIFIIIEEE
ncbi:septum formation initiator family protein [Ancylomarina salipaludis]|nr:septum formation initiator family protein [Ancylomarina salipaludis]